MRSIAALVGVLALGLMPSFAHAADAQPFNDTQKAAIESIVRNLLENKEPELVMKAAKNFQQKMEADNAVKSAEGIKKNKDKLFNNPDSIIGGNPKGDVTVVEFFDYQCGYCKAAQPFVAKLLTEDKMVKFVYVEMPILGAPSLTAAKAALASVKQGKYEKMHQALMTVKDRLTDDVVFSAAKTAGLDVEKLKKDMEDPSIMKTIQANVMLAGEIGAHGTPTFIIGDKSFPGVLPYDQLKAVVEGARKESKEKK